MDDVVARVGKMRNSYTNFSLIGRDHFRGPGMDTMIILKQNVNRP
jgi:hypothetical protein